MINAWVVTTRRGTQAVVSNDKGWENFLLNLTMSSAVIAVGVYIPVSEIDSILPLQEGAPPPKTMAEVIRLVPNSENPGGLK